MEVIDAKMAQPKAYLFFFGFLIGSPKAGGTSVLGSETPLFSFFWSAILEGGGDVYRSTKRYSVMCIGLMNIYIW